MSAVYLSCGSCFTRTRVEKIAPPMMIIEQYHCPTCGTPTPWGQDQEEDYWYDLAAAFKLPRNQEGVELIKGLYDIWDTSEFKSFRKFVESLDGV